MGGGLGVWLYITHTRDCEHKKNNNKNKKHKKKTEEKREEEERLEMVPVCVHAPGMQRTPTSVSSAVRGV